MLDRWESLPISEQEQKYLASTTTTTHAPKFSSIRRSLGRLIRQEISETGQNICYYRGGSNDSSIPYLCELGCCNHGCCSVADLAARSSSFVWALGLLSIVVITIIFAMIAILVVYVMNRQKDKALNQQLAESTIEGSSVSNLNGPTSFYQHAAYYHPYIANFKNY